MNPPVRSPKLLRGLWVVRRGNMAVPRISNPVQTILFYEGADVIIALDLPEEELKRTFALVIGIHEREES
jgi:hypothetical protein